MSWKPDSPYSQDNMNRQAEERRAKEAAEYQAAVNRDRVFWENFNKPKTNSPGGGSGGGSASKLICNQLLKAGHITQAEFLLSMHDFRDRLTVTHLRGYHFWAIPTVKMMRRSNRTTVIVAMLFNRRMRVIQSRNCASSNASLVDKALCAFGENISFLIGSFVKPSDRWRDVYDSKEQPANISPSKLT